MKPINSLEAKVSICVFDSTIFPSENSIGPFHVFLNQQKKFAKMLLPLAVVVAFAIRGIGHEQPSQQAAHGKKTLTHRASQLTIFQTAPTCISECACV